MWFAHEPFEDEEDAGVGFDEDEDARDDDRDLEWRGEQAEGDDEVVAPTDAWMVSMST